MPSQVWLRFEKKKKDDEVMKLRIQDLPPERIGEAVDLMVRYFVKDEPFRKAVGFINNPKALEEYRNCVEKTFRDPASRNVMCCADTDKENPDIMGISSIGVVSESYADQLCLILCVCTYCVVRIRRLQQSGQVTILLRPTKVMFSHKNEDDGKEELRTVVAYQNPFTGDYCVHKSHPPKGYVNALPSSESTDSGVSEEYEPLKPVEKKEGDYGPFNIQEHGQLQSVCDANGVNKTWNWNYKEYQI